MNPPENRCWQNLINENRLVAAGLERLAEISDHIAQDNLRAAEKWVNSIFDSVTLLQDFPYHGRIVPEIKRPEIREMLFKKYRVIYRVEKDQISILTVRHGMQILPVDEIVTSEF